MLLEKQNAIAAVKDRLGTTFAISKENVIANQDIPETNVVSVIKGSFSLERNFSWHVLKVETSKYKAAFFES